MVKEMRFKTATKMKEFAINKYVFENLPVTASGCHRVMSQGITSADFFGFIVEKLVWNQNI